jgi:predicted acyltransferase (DUF342 family)
MEMIIDENFKGIQKDGNRFVLEGNILARKVVINVPLFLSGTIEAIESLEVNEWLWVNESIEVGEKLKANKWLKVDGYVKVTGSVEVNDLMIVGRWFEVEKSVEVGGSLEVGGWLKVKEYLYVDNSLKVGRHLEVGGLLKVFGYFTSVYALFTIEKYQVTFTSKIIKIGCEKNSIDDWKKLTDEQIRLMDDDALEWSKRWRDFILTVHSSLPNIYPK